MDGSKSAAILEAYDSILNKVYVLVNIFSSCMTYCNNSSSDNNVQVQFAYEKSAEHFLYLNTLQMSLLPPTLQKFF